MDRNLYYFAFELTQKGSCYVRVYLLIYIVTTLKSNWDTGCWYHFYSPIRKSLSQESEVLICRNENFIGLIDFISLTHVHFNLFLAIAFADGYDL